MTPNEPETTRGETKEPVRVAIAGPTRYKPLRTLAKLVTAGLALYAASIVVRLGLSLRALDLGQRFLAGEEISDETINEFSDNVDFAYGVSLVILLLCAVLFSIWTYRAAKNARAFGTEGMTISPGWAVGYYYVPILNLWRPFTAFCEVWRASDPEGRPEYWIWSRAPVPLWLTAWWVAWVLSGVVDRFTSRMFEDELAVEAWMSVHRWNLFALGAAAVALILAVTVVWGLTRRQETKARGGVPRAQTKSARD